MKHLFYPLLCLVLGLSLPAYASSDDWLGKLVNKPSSEPLPPELAFSVKARRVDTKTIMVDFAVTPAYYLYKDKLLIVLKNTTGTRIGGIDFPPAVTKNDLSFGDTQVYTKPFSIKVELAGDGTGPITLLTRYQGCFETRGLCYTPQSATLTLP